MFSSSSGVNDSTMEHHHISQRSAEISSAPMQGNDSQLMLWGGLTEPPLRWRQHCGKEIFTCGCTWEIFSCCHGRRQKRAVRKNKGEDITRGENKKRKQRPHNWKTCSLCTRKTETTWWLHTTFMYTIGQKCSSCIKANFSVIDGQAGIINWDNVLVTTEWPRSDSERSASTRDTYICPWLY